MKDLGYGSGYKYAHDFKDHFINLQFLPDDLKNYKFWTPQENPTENKMKEKMESLWGKRYK